jgi:hypothetical protein
MAQLDAIDGRNAVKGSALTVYGAGITGNYALANDLSAAGTTYTRAVVSDFPTFLTSMFGGRIDGLGHVVTDLTINATSGMARDQVGLVGIMNGTVSNIGVVGGSITGRSNVGAVVGNVSSAGATVQNSRTVTAASFTDWAVAISPATSLING